METTHPQPIEFWTKSLVFEGKIQNDIHNHSQIYRQTARISNVSGFRSASFQIPIQWGLNTERVRISDGRWRSELGWVVGFRTVKETKWRQFLFG